jgi:hypothetical protein
MDEPAPHRPKLVIEKPARRRQTVEHTAQIVGVRSFHNRLPQYAREELQLQFIEIACLFMQVALVGAQLNRESRADAGANLIAPAWWSLSIVAKRMAETLSAKRRRSGLFITGDPMAFAIAPDDEAMRSWGVRSWA